MAVVEILTKTHPSSASRRAPRLVAVALALSVLTYWVPASVKAQPATQPATQSTAQPAAQGEVADPVLVVSQWLQALERGDMEGALSWLSQDAYLIFSDPNLDTYIVVEGIDEIREELRLRQADNFAIKIIEAPGEVNGTVTWLEGQSSDSLRQLGLLSVEVRGDAIVDDGKVRSVIYEPTPESAELIAQAHEEAGEEAVQPLSPRGEAAAEPGADMGADAGASVEIAVGMPRAGGKTHTESLSEFLSLTPTVAACLAAIALALGGLLRAYSRT